MLLLLHFHAVATLKQMLHILCKDGEAEASDLLSTIILHRLSPLPHLHLSIGVNCGSVLTAVGAPVTVEDRGTLGIDDHGGRRPGWEGMRHRNG